MSELNNLKTSYKRSKQAFASKIISKKSYPIGVFVEKLNLAHFQRLSQMR